MPTRCDAETGPRRLGVELQRDAFVRRDLDDEIVRAQTLEVDAANMEIMRLET